MRFPDGKKTQSEVRNFWLVNSACGRLCNSRWVRCLGPALGKAHCSDYSGADMPVEAFGHALNILSTALPLLLYLGTFYFVRERVRQRTFGGNNWQQFWGEILGGNVGRQIWAEQLGEHVGRKSWLKIFVENIGLKCWAKVKGGNVDQNIGRPSAPSSSERKKKGCSLMVVFRGSTSQDNPYNTN